MDFKVLVIDDDKVFTWMHEVAVKKSGLHPAPISFIQAKDALAYIEENVNDDSLYLLLLDINMPEMSGWELLDSLQDKPYLKNLHVIMVTSSIENKDKEKAAAYSSVIEYAEKPITINYCRQVRDMEKFSEISKLNVS